MKILRLMISEKEEIEARLKSKFNTNKTVTLILLLFYDFLKTKK